MKKHGFLVSQNDWEYSGHVTIEAENIKITWEGDKYDLQHDPYRQDSDGQTVIADGVKITFDEPFEYLGVNNER